MQLVTDFKNKSCPEINAALCPVIVKSGRIKEDPEVEPPGRAINLLTIFARFRYLKNIYDRKQPCFSVSILMRIKKKPCKFTHSPPSLWIFSPLSNLIFLENSLKNTLQSYPIYKYKYLHQRTSKNLKVFIKFSSNIKLKLSYKLR